MKRRYSTCWKKQRKKKRKKKAIKSYQPECHRFHYESFTSSQQNTVTTIHNTVKVLPNINSATQLSQLDTKHCTKITRTILQRKRDSGEETTQVFFKTPLYVQNIEQNK